MLNARSLPKLKLSDLLRRRKMTLKQYLDKFGIDTYAGVCASCERMGVHPPDEREFDVVHPTAVNSPGEGVIVVEEPVTVLTIPADVALEDLEDTAGPAEDEGLDVEGAPRELRRRPRPRRPIVPDALS